MPLRLCAWLALLPALLAAGCSTQQVVKENATRATVASQEVPENQLLDVSIQVVTLREHESVQGGRHVRWTEIEEHGRLRDLVRTRELATVLDLEALERSQASARVEAPAP